MLALDGLEVPDLPFVLTGPSCSLTRADFGDHVRQRQAPGTDEQSPEAPDAAAVSIECWRARGIAA